MALSILPEILIGTYYEISIMTEDAFKII